MSPPVMRNDAISLAQEEQHLRVPIVRAQRPAMVKHDWLPGTPILVENLGSVFGFDEGHGFLRLWPHGTLGKDSDAFRCVLWADCPPHSMGLWFHISLAIWRVVRTTPQKHTLK